MSSLGVDIQEARAQALSLSDEALSVDLVDGRTVIVPLVWYPRLVTVRTFIGRTLTRT